MINGSPRRSKSNTQYIADALLEGAREAGARTEVAYLYETKMLSCQGEFHCFEQDPGKCMYIKKDGAQALWERARTFDLIIIGSGLYADFYTGKTKTFIERVLPLLDPHLEKNGDPNYVDPSPPEGTLNWILSKLAPYVLPLIEPNYDPDAVGEYHHRLRVDDDGNKIEFPPLAFICNAGLPEQSQFDAVKQYAQSLKKNLRTEVVAEIYRGQGELFTFQTPVLNPIFERYKRTLRQAGRELVREGEFSAQTKVDLEKPLIHHDVYMALANAHFDRVTGDTSSPFSRLIETHRKGKELTDKLRKGWKDRMGK